MYQHLFGPVPSRRLGVSLGVDLVPHKTCTLNCLYCECGRTTNFTIQRKEYVPTKELISELTAFLSSKPKLDYITFSGAGEPTLHSDIGKIIEFIKEHFPHYKLALITNATLFYLPELREEVKAVDLTLPSLDAATEKTFKKLNRPVPQIKAKHIIEGLVEFRKIYPGKIWLEIFIVPGINDTGEEIDHLRQAIHRIKPDLVQLNTLDRPGTESSLQPADVKQLYEIAEQLDWRTELISKFKIKDRIDSYNADVEGGILQTIKRRPSTAEDLSSALGLPVSEINRYLKTLLSHKKIISETMDRGVFFKALNQEEVKK